MIPPPPGFGLYWTDEQIVTSLDKFIKGSPFPDDVIFEINPFMYKPSNLPDGLWYFVKSIKTKESEHGFWKARGEACEIYKDSVISGWRTTLEFFEAPAPLGQQTDWLMQEYTLTETGPCGKNEPKDRGILCRIFRCGGEGGPSTQTDANKNITSAESAETQVKTMESPVTEKGPNPVSDNLLDLEYCILNGDYLELDDLADQESRASSSDNSSRFSTISDELFDSLLGEIGDDPNNEEPNKGSSSSSNFNVAAFAKPNEVVMHPGSVGSLATVIASKSPDQKKEPAGSTINPSVERQQAEYISEGASSSHGEASSSNGQKSNDVSGSKKKLKKKYLCFISFII